MAGQQARLDNEFEAGWKAARAQPPSDAEVEAAATALDTASEGLVACLLAKGRSYRPHHCVEENDMRSLTFLIAFEFGWFILAGPLT